MNIAVVGTGIAGLTAAYLLSRKHQVTVFEANDYIGGHTHTVNVDHQDKTYAVDTGFIVYNDWTYPNFIKLMDQLGCPSQVSNMSFSVSCEKTGLEYNGANLDTLYAQRKNIFNFKFHRMLLNILRFNKESVNDLKEGRINCETTLSHYLKENGYSDMFRDYYILPMGGAIWSATRKTMLDFPLQFFTRFFNNHGMLSVENRPTWRVLKGGSSSYIEKIIQAYQERIHLNTPIESIKREMDHVLVKPKGQDAQRFDHVVLACHSDQALAMLSDPSLEERDILGALPYQANDVVLHTDQRLLPKCRKTWASWNVKIPTNPTDLLTMTYNMNILQTIEAPTTFCVTLNDSDAIDPETVIEKYVYHHPVYTVDGIKAQARYDEIGGVNRTHFCGAYWFNGFHEDGVKSGLRVAEYFEETL